MKIYVALLSLSVLIACKDKKEKPKIDIPPPPVMMNYSIIKTYPHDTSSYTQGLQIYKGNLYEGTGNYGFSKLLKVNLATGEILQSISLPKEYFGEGITILNDTIYQLTWKEKKVFVYTLKDFKKVKTFDANIEGWGLTNDGKNLIVSTGSSDLSYYDPSNFSLLKKITVTESGNPTFNINELEYIDGYIYANQYQLPYILKIDPASGKIVAKADLTSMWEKIKAIDPEADVPNGIAYDAATKKMYITGKWWPTLFEIQLGQ